MILLTSSMASVATDLFEKFLKEKKYQKLLFIDTAAEPYGKDEQWLLDDVNALAALGYVIDRYSFSSQTAQQIESKLHEYQLMHVSGGNTFYLLQQIQKAQAQGLIKDFIASGKTYIGTSAGSIIMGNDIAPVEDFDEARKALDLEGTRGLGIVDVTVLPHWGSDYFKQTYLTKTVKSIFKSKLKFILLNDQQYLHVGADAYYKVIDIND